MALPFNLTGITTGLILLFSCGNKEITAEDQRDALTFRDTLVVLNNMVIDSTNRLIALAGQLGHHQLGPDPADSTGVPAGVENQDSTTITIEQIDRQYEATVNTIRYTNSIIEELEEYDPDFNLRQITIDAHNQLLKLITTDLKKFTAMLANGVHEKDRRKVQSLLMSLTFGLLNVQNKYRDQREAFDRKYNIVS